MKCPCHECLVKAACKNRDYHKLTSECIQLRVFLIYGGEVSLGYPLHKRRVKEFVRVLKSNVWYLGRETDDGYLIMPKSKEIK